MLRLVGFFVLCLLAMQVLQALPGIGGFFHGLFGFWIVAILLSLGLTRLSGWMLKRARLQRRLSELGQVDSPRNFGKLGALYVAHGRPRAALEPLDRALEADPENLEWRYRRGQAQLALGRAEEAVADFERVANVDEEYQYGGVQLSLAEACTRVGNYAGALEALGRFDRNHGEKPESVYRRGLALRAAGRRDEARRSFARVAEVARGGARFQRRESAGWAARAALARWF